MEFLSGVVSKIASISAAIVSSIYIAISPISPLISPNTPTPTQSPQPTLNTQISSSLANLSDSQTVKVEGSYSYIGQEIKYNFAFPKKGGTISGDITGVCSGPVKGDFSGGNSGNLKGSVQLNCNFGFINKSLSVDFTGKTDLPQNLIYLTLESNGQKQPFTIKY